MELFHDLGWLFSKLEMCPILVHKCSRSLGPFDRVNLRNPVWIHY